MIIPKAANGIAAALLPQRLHWIQNDDTNAIKQAETYPIVDSDLGLSDPKAQFHQSAVGARQGSGLPTVSGVNSYVPHQSTYPATFLSVVKLSDGTGGLMGFYRNSVSGTWLLALYAQIPTYADLGLARRTDGFAPAPFPAGQTTYQNDPGRMVGYYIATKCQKTPPCRVPTAGPSPRGVRADAVSGAILDDHVAGIAQDEQGFASEGLQETYLFGGAKPEDYPGYRLGSGGSLRFFTFQELYYVTAQQQGACVMVTQFPLIPDGTYRGYTITARTLVALEVPKTDVAGNVTVVAAQQPVQTGNAQRC